MPRYFFNVEGNAYYPHDAEGIVLADADEARSHAVVAAGELLKDADGEFWDKPEWRMQVTDEEGGTVCILVVRGMTRVQ